MGVVWGCVTSARGTKVHVMTTVTPLRRPKGIGEIVAAEIRVLIARYGTTQRDLAALIGVSQSQFSKRMHGTVPMDIFELETIAAHFGLSVVELLSGQQSAPRPGGPDGGQGLGRARQDSNLQPSDPKVRGSVIELFPAA